MEALNSFDGDARIAIPCTESPITDEATRSKLSRAISDLQTAVRYDPSLTHAYLLLGRTSCLLGDYDGAVESYLVYTSLRPDNPLGYLELGFTNEILGEKDLATQNWRLAGVTLDALLTIIEASRKNGQYAKMLSWSIRAQWMEPEWGRPWYLAGMAHEGLEDSASALSNFQRAIDLSPTDVDPYYAMGNLLQKIHNYTEAARVYQLAAARDPIPIKAYLNLAQAQEQLDHSEQAIVAYQEAVRLSALVEGNSADAEWKRIWPHYALGDYYLRTGALDEAVAAFELALGLDTKNSFASWSLWGLGRVSLLKAQYEQAKSLFFRALEYTENRYLRSQVNLKIGETIIQQGNMNQGIEYLTIALDEYPNNPGLHRFLADTLLTAGRLEEAIQLYESYLIKWPSDPNVILSLQKAREALIVQQP